MNKFLSFLIFFCLSGFVNGQEITDDFVESLLHRGDKDYYCLQSVFKLNYYLQQVGGFDTIAYRRDGKGVRFSYQGEVISEICDRKNLEGPVSIYGGVTGHTIKRHQGVFRTSSGIEMRINIRNSYLHKIDNEVVIAYYQDDVLIGPYLELTLDNTLTKKGNYQQIDSLYVDTVITVNPATYEIYDEYVPRKKYPLKIGTWVYRNRSVDTLKVEHYPEKYE